MAPGDKGYQFALPLAEAVGAAGESGRLVPGMRVEDQRKFFKAAFKSITLDGYERRLARAGSHVER